MAIQVKHSKVSTIPDADDTSLVRPSDWNADHTLSGTIDVVNGGTGASTANGALTNLLPSQTGNSGKFLSTNGTNTLWSSPSGSGDVVGPASATDNAITRFDGTTGKLIQNSTITIDDNGNVININSLGLDTTPATVPTSVGTISWDDGDGVPQVILKGGNTTLQIGTQEYARVYNDSGTTLTKGQAVYISGAQGNRVAVRLARADVESTSFGTLGLVAESIANGAEGYVIVSGALYKLNTTGLTAGATVYLSPSTAGGITTTKPQAPDQLVVLGWVERVDNIVGSIYVKVDNGYEIDELHDVRITSPQSGNLLIYDASTSPIGVWKNANLTDGTGITITEGAGSITVTNSGVTGLTAGTGISLSGSTGNVTVTNSAPDQVVSLTAGSNVTITGTYPNFTIAASGGGSAATPTALGTVYGSTAGSASIYNALFGYQAGNAFTTGGNFVALGYQAGYNTVTSADGAPPVYVGWKAGFASTGNNYDSVAVGENALRAQTTGYQNTAIGGQAGYSLTTANENTLIGASAGINVTGSNNTTLGSSAGSNITSGANNIVIGRSATASSATVSNEATWGNSSITSNRFWGDLKMGGSSAGTSGQVLTSQGAGASPTWTTPSGGASNITVDNKTAAYTVVAGDLGKVINCTSGTFTVSLTAAATLGAGFNVTIWNTGTGAITIDPAGSETIDGKSTLILRNGEGTQIICTGTAWNTGDKKTMRAYAEQITNTTTRPIASGSNSVAIGAGASAAGTNAIAVGNDAGAPNNNSAAIGRFAYATADGSIALGYSRTSGTDSLAAIIQSDASFYGAAGNSSIAIGAFAYVESSANYGIAIGNNALVSTGAEHAVSIGKNNQALQPSSFAFGRESNSNSYGKYAYSSGTFGPNYGDAQRGLVVLKASTTDATATVLTSNNSTPSTNNQLQLDNNSAFAFTGTVVARQKAADGTASAAWKIEGLIRREANAGTTTLVASTVTAISNAPSWTLALAADTTNGALEVKFTGAASTNIQVVATIDSSEVIYA